MSEVLVSQDGVGIRTITLNRPDALNAIRGVTWPQLDRAVCDAAIDPGVRVVVMAGAGRTEDFREALAALAGKRPPVFKRI